MRALAVIGAVGLLGAAACKKDTRRDLSPESATTKDEAPVDVALDAARPWTDAWLEAESQRYLQDGEFRRAVLEASLTNPNNIYSRTRLSGYGLARQGWDMLPEWIPRTRAIDDAYVEALQAGAPLALDARATPLWDGTTPTGMDEWVDLGRRVFHEYPLRSEIFAEHALRSSALAERVGLGSDRDGFWPGVVAYQTLEGKVEIGITCSLCHVSMEDGEMIEGRARRVFDYGEMRLAFYRDTGAFLAEDLKQRMASWGPGRADITQDDDEDPVAIVDLWGVRDHAYLTQSGTLRQTHPAALAIRQETQILHANQERIRPPRALAWALAMYVYSLEPPDRAAAPESAELARGRSLFMEACQRCHEDPSFGGNPIPAEVVGTDATLARGTARGTGLYRPSPLIRVSDAAPYLHDGSVPTLAALFDPERKVIGHRYGTSWPAQDRQALIVYLETL